MPFYRQQNIELCKIPESFAKVMKFDRMPYEPAEFMFWMFVGFLKELRSPFISKQIFITITLTVL